VAVYCKISVDDVIALLQFHILEEQSSYV